MDTVFFFLIGFLVWAALGHFFWRFITWPFANMNMKHCSQCDKKIHIEDRACRHCGWTSVSVDVKRSLLICRQAIDSAYNRKLIDKEGVERGLEVLAKLERQLDLERSPVVSKPRELPSTTLAQEPSEPKLTYAPSHDELQVARPIEPAHRSPSMDKPVVIPPVPATVPQESQIHALERDYDDEKPAAVETKAKLPKRTWTQLLGAFMEESNIRWGEIIGGLLIVCCSTALVISFWEHIANRPWLKFSIFTGINVATFGLGLYAWHRWKLPTTSKGILVIGMMQMPLNFLAFALFTMGMPWDWPTVAGEMASMAILGCLAFLASKILTPGSVVVTTAAPVLFGLANLLIRRTVNESAELPLLYTWGIALVALYAGVTALVRRPLIRDAQGQFAPFLEFFALSTFGLLLSLGLLVRCSHQSVETIRLLSPLLTLLATPVLFTAIDIYKRLQTPSSLQVPMLLVGTFAIALGCVSVFLAWPAPLLMIGAGVGLLVMLAAAGALLQRGGLIYPASLVVSFLLVLAWFGFKGQLDWMNHSSEVLILRLMTPTTGFIWVGYSLVCAAVAIVLGKIGKLNGSIGLMQSALMSGGLGTILLTAFGFGREAYATSLGATYFVYAIAAMTFASIRRNPWLEIVAVAFMVSASFQWIIIGWTGFEWWDRLYASVFALTLALLVGMVVQRVLGFETASDRPISTACFFSLCVFTSLAVTRSISHEPLLAASFLWFVFTWLQKENLYWTITQFVASSALVGGVIRSCIDASWWPNQAANQFIGFVHPIFIQYLALSLFITGIVLIVFDAALKRLSNSIGLAILGPLKQIHDASVARVLIGFGSVLTLCVMLYGAIPGLSQEIIPIDALTSTELSPMKRSIPDLRSLELNGVPHAAAAWGRDSGSFRVWGLPPILASWGIGLISLICACWNLRKDGSNAWGSWAGFLAALLISIWYPLATLAEPSIAVASTLRWLTAGVLFLACLILSFWIQRMDRTQVFVAKERGELFDKLLRVISIQSLSPWLLMGATAIGMIMLQFKNVPGFTSLGNGFIWVVALFMAFAALVFMMLPRLSKSETADQQASLWAIVASTLLITPLLAWTMLSVAVTVIDHPLTGPDPGTFFHKLGLAASYSIPIFLIACGLISVAAARPSPRLAFIAALFLMASIAAGYLLVLKSRGVHVESWIGLCAIVSISGSVYGLVWKWMVAMDHRPDDWLQDAVPPIPQVRNNLQTALSHISAGFAVVGLAMIFYQILIPRTSSSGLVWCSAGILTALLFHFFQSVKGDSGLKLSPWIATGGAACMGIIAPNFSTSASALGASGLVILFAGFLVALLSFRIDAVTNRRTNPRFAIWFVLAIATCIGFRAFFDASPLATTRRSFEELVPVAILAAAWALSALITWIHSDRWTWFLSFLILQSTGLFFSILNAASMNSSEFAWTAGLFIQIALAAISSSFATMCGFGRKSRVPLILGTFALFTMSMIWLLMVFAFGASSTAWSSGAISDLPTFHLPWYAVAIIACLIGGFTGFWNLRSKDEHTVVYLAGLSSAIWLIQYSGATGPMFYWLSTIILAAYCLAASFLWVSGERIQQELSALLRIPRAAEKPSSMMVVPINTLLAFAVVSLGVMSLFVQESQNFRFISANAIMAAAFAVGFLSQHASIRGSATPMRVLALSIGVVYAIALFWHVQPPKTPLAFRFAVVPLPVVLTAAVYGFGLIKWFGSKKGWEQAGMILVPWIVSLAIIIGAATVFLETQLPSLTVRATADLYSPICLVLSLLIAIVLSIGAAILPGKDPLGLSQKGKEAYVYGAQAIVVLLIVHLRITMPFLFSGWLQSIWPLLVVAIGFAGVGLSQWSERRGLTVLANPLLNSGSLLPLLPVLAPWIAPSNVDQGATMLMSAVGYGMFGYYRASPIYITASILCANIAFWQLLSKNQFSFVEHPQLWVIPPALCVFAAGQFFKDRLTPTQLASIRYTSVGSIYVASTSELVLQGIAKAPWLPIVLAILSVLGIIFGIAARIRSMLWLGSMFLAVAMFSILWYAAVDLNQTWLWYVCGIVLGAVMLFVFAMFEKRREELKRLMSNVQQWEE